jgi:uncharacterized lipoprotein YmbA
MRRRTVGCFAALVALGSACLSKPALVPQTFSIDPPPERTVRPMLGARVVCLREVEVAPQFDRRDLVYRTGAHRLERDPHAAFAAPPGPMLTDAIVAHLRNASSVRGVVRPGDDAPADVVIEVHATELSADLASSGGAAALVTLEFVVIPARPSGLAQGAFRKQYARRALLARRTASAAVEAWNGEVADIMDDFVMDLERFLAAPRAER